MQKFTEKHLKAMPVEDAIQLIKNNESEFSSFQSYPNGVKVYVHDERQTVEFGECN